MGWTAHFLPNLQDVTRMDELLRQVSKDDAVVREGIAIATSALADARRDGNTRMQASFLGYLAEAHRVIGELDEAEAFARRALTIPCDEPYGPRIANLIRLGEVLRCQNRFDDAIEAHVAALSEIRDVSTERYRSFALQHLGKVYLNRGDREQAESAFSMALEIRRREGNEALISSTEEALRFARQGQGELKESFARPRLRTGLPGND